MPAEAATPPPESSGGQLVLSEQELQGLVCGLLSNDRARQEQLIRRHYSPEVEFCHFLGKTRERAQRQQPQPLRMAPSQRSN